MTDDQDHSERSLHGVRLLFVVNVDWFFISHRFPLLEAARGRGAVTAVAAADTGRLDEIAAAGAEVFVLPISRSGTGLIEQVRGAYAIGCAVRHFRPDIVHNVTIKPVLFGTLATRLLSRRAKVVNAISGFGFVVEGGATPLLRAVVVTAYRWLFRSRRVAVVVQNEAARATVVRQRLAEAEQVVLIEGSGVDCHEFHPSEMARPTDRRVRVLMASRILRDKGVEEYCRAAGLLDREKVHALLVGSLDPEGNPTALSQREIDQLCRANGVEYLGERDDMPALLRAVDVFVLPSYHEGLPKALLEAAATGLPLVATDIPGCRPVVLPGRNGELVAARAVEALAAAIRRLADDPDLRRRYGAESRRLAVERFAVDLVVARFVKLYARLVADE